MFKKETIYIYTIYANSVEIGKVTDRLQAKLLAKNYELMGNTVKIKKVAGKC